MSTWVLILTLYSLMNNGSMTNPKVTPLPGSGTVAIAAVPGFTSEDACNAAAGQWTHDMEKLGFAHTECVKQ